MSILKKRGQAALTHRQQRRARGNRPMSEQAKLEGRSHATRQGSSRARSRTFQDIPQPKQNDADAKFRRAFKGGVKLSAEERFRRHGGAKGGGYTWDLRRRRRRALET